MGSALIIRVMKDMPEAELRLAVAERRSQDAYEDGHSYSGSWGSTHGLRVSSRTFPSVEEAEQYVEQSTAKHEPLLAVKARRAPKANKPSARITALEEKSREAQNAVFSFPQTVINRVRAGKSKTRGCSKCGSSIAVTHIRSTHCPVCTAPFLYGTTDESRLKGLTQKKDALEAQLKEARSQEIEKLERRGVCTLVWVVGGWCPE